MSRSPCKNCPDRAINCHSGCTKYQEFANVCEERRQERKERVDNLYGLNDVREKSYKKNLRDSFPYFKCHKK
jgi:hypothetical protein